MILLDNFNAVFTPVHSTEHCISMVSHWQMTLVISEDFINEINRKYTMKGCS